MVAFVFYVSAALIIFTLVAALADLSLWWQARRDAEDLLASGERGS